MKRPLSTDLDIILMGEPVEAMEAAKRLIAKNDQAHVETLIPIVKNKRAPLWSRIAAIYTLGFIDLDAVAVPTLRAIGGDYNESEMIRDHALEALEHLDGCC